MSNPSDRIAEIRARHEAATPGDWTVKPPIKGWIDITAMLGGPVAHPNPPVGVACIRPDRHSHNNATFVAAAHQDIPWLLSQLEEAMKHVRTLLESPVAAPYYPVAEPGIQRAQSWLTSLSQPEEPTS